MKNLISFELKKIIKDKKTLFILCCLLVSLFVGFLFVQQEQKDLYEVETFLTESIHSALGGEIHEYVDADDFYGADSQAIQEVMRQINESVGERNDHQVLASMKSKTLYLKELRALKKLTGVEPLDEDTISRELLITDHFLKKEVKPVYNEQGADGFSFMSTVFQYWSNWLGLLVLIFCLFNFWASDYEKRSIRLMYSQPTARRKQRLAKFSAAIIFSFGLLAALLLLAFLLGTVVNGVGSFNYPLMIEKGSSIRFIPLYSYFFQSLVLYLLGIISLLALVTFLSSLTSKASLVLVLTFILSLGGTIGIESFMAGPNYWPYSLANSWHFIRSYGGIELNGHFWFACLSLLLFSAALLCGTEFNQKGRSLNQ